MEYRLNGREIAIDYSDDESEDDHYKPISYLQDESLSPSDQLEQDEIKENNFSLLRHSLKKLDDRSRVIVEARWLSSNKSETLHELAAKFDVSAERIRQIEQNALSKLKALMVPDS
jgi:RNA polymerase sigma-32 factor